MDSDLRKRAQIDSFAALAVGRAKIALLYQYQRVLGLCELSLVAAKDALFEAVAA
jgi:hypothetical protein